MLKNLIFFAKINIIILYKLMIMNYLGGIDKIDWKEKLHVILEWHAIILNNPEELDGVFWYWTHTCSLITVEWEGKIWMVHVHERIWSDDLKAFLWEFWDNYRVNIVWWSDKMQSLIKSVIEENHISNYESSQCDAVIRMKNWVAETRCLNPKKQEQDEVYVQNKVKKINNHIKSWLLIFLQDYSNGKWKTFPLIIEHK